MSQKDRVTIYCPRELIEWFDGEAERQGVTRSRCMYGALEFYRTIRALSSLGEMGAGAPPPAGRPGRRSLMRTWLAEQRRRETVQAEIDLGRNSAI